MFGIMVTSVTINENISRNLRIADEEEHYAARGYMYGEKAWMICVDDPKFYEMASTASSVTSFPCKFTTLICPHKVQTLRTWASACRAN